MANGEGQRLEGARFLPPRFPFFIFLSTTSLAAAEGGGKSENPRRGCHWTTPAASAAQSWLSFKG